MLRVWWSGWRKTFREKVLVEGVPERAALDDKWSGTYVGQK